MISRERGGWASRGADRTPTSGVCPDKQAGLQPWTPGHSEDHRVSIVHGREVLLSSSATVHSIEILDGAALGGGGGGVSRSQLIGESESVEQTGSLVIADTDRPILLRTKHILIGNKGELHVGSPDCPYRGNFTISLFGSNQNSYLFQRGWGNRGIVVHVIDPKTGEVLRNDRFDTYRSKDESRRLAQYVDAVDTGLLLAMVVNDEGSNNLEDTAKRSLAKLGSQHATRLGFR
ncbi:hypothetical protein CRUP_012529 [Coryphaenoides rupestris]|nr:hypothetical protein CRUP_012529 [Coryphaenoides rupestris]